MSLELWPLILATVVCQPAKLGAVVGLWLKMGETFTRPASPLPLCLLKKPFALHMVTLIVTKMQPQEIILPAGQFKARCLRLMDEVNEQGTVITITKHGRPVARLVPTVSKPLSPAELYGAMAGMATAAGDLEAPVDEVWEANG